MERRRAAAPQPDKKLTRDEKLICCPRAKYANCDTLLIRFTLICD